MERAIAINVPWVIHQLLKVVLPFMDPVTRAKLSFNQPTPFIPDEQLLCDFGGKLNLDPRTTEYREVSPERASGAMRGERAGVLTEALDPFRVTQSLIALCREKRQAYRERWVKGGSQVRLHSLLFTSQVYACH